jgi:hypothetical protein
MAKIDIIILRKPHALQTLGNAVLYIEDSEMRRFKTLELPWLGNQKDKSCIPPGKYRAAVRTSPKYGRHLHILDVPGRSLILMHYGNYAGSLNPKTGNPDTRGCILPGTAFVDMDGDGVWDIAASRATMQSIMDLINDDDKIQLEIMITPAI